MKIEEFIRLLAEERDLDLRGYKLSTLERRISKRMNELATPHYEGYLQYVERHPEETNRLLDTILINVTEFFRDPGAWQALAGDIVPYLVKKLRTGDSFRAWVAGCSTGEEVYSLAILLADYFGERLAEFDIKLYATDVDESALNVARRGEYTPERLRRVRPEWRYKYFSSAALPRVNRDIRRMCIFGRSDVAQDAPISHVQIVVCRNVLIYFDAIAQRHILSRFHYALDGGGILFLGKSESKLSNSPLFKPVDSRWRIFRKDQFHKSKEIPFIPSRSETLMANDGSSEREHELARLALHHRALLEILEPGIISLDANDIIVTDNKSALELWGLSGNKLAGQHLAESVIGKRHPELVHNVEESHKSPDRAIRFECAVDVNGESRALTVTLKSVNGDNSQRIGTLIYAENVSHRVKLQTTIEQLEATGEQLHSANEELETTNEELQSTNEELETTNEELQSTNEELETTNEELQSLNEELENMNEELEFRTRELDQLNSRYAETLERIPWAVMVLDSDDRVQFWNSAAEKLFDMRSASVIGLELSQLPIQPKLRDALVRRRKTMDVRKTPTQLRNQEIRVKRAAMKFNVHLTPLSRDSGKPSLLLMFAPQNGERENSLGASRSLAAKEKGSAKKVTRGNSRKK